MVVVSGSCQAPKPDHLYCVFRSAGSGFAVGVVIRGDDCNWNAAEIVAHAELPLEMERSVAWGFITGGAFELKEVEVADA